MDCKAQINALKVYYDKMAPDYEEYFHRAARYSVSAQEFLDEHVRDGMRVLDAACGPGHLTRALSAAVEVVGFDISIAMIETARGGRPRGIYFQHDYHAAIPMERGFFDVVLALGCVEFCDDLGGVLGHLAETLYPGGRMLVSTLERRPRAIDGVEQFAYSDAQMASAIAAVGLVERGRERLATGDVLWDLERPRPRIRP